nr:heavy metal-binding domain-containing protein [uncultured Roseovarius sp.]
MANCSECGRRLGLLQAGMNGMCPECALGVEGQKMRDTVEEHAAIKADIDAVLLTTETCPKGLQIVERIEIVTAECAFGMNIFKDLFAGVRDIVGGRSEAVQRTLRDTRRTALYELKKEAYDVGANAVIGVDLDYTELSVAGNMVLLVVSGTAVRVTER